MHHQNKQYSFSKEEKLCSKKQIAHLFQFGKWEKTSNLRLVYYILDENTAAPPKLLISVPKKLFKKAVVRNRIKRRIREAYRLNKGELDHILSLFNGELLLGFIYSSSTIEEYVTLENEMIQLLKILEVKLRN